MAAEACGECHLKPGERCDICGRIEISSGETLSVGDLVVMDNDGAVRRARPGEDAAPLPMDFAITPDGKLEVPNWWRDLYDRWS